MAALDLTDGDEHDHQQEDDHKVDNHEDDDQQEDDRNYDSQEILNIDLIFLSVMLYMYKMF